MNNPIWIMTSAFPSMTFRQVAAKAREIGAQRRCGNLDTPGIRRVRDHGGGKPVRDQREGARCLPGLRDAGKVNGSCRKGKQQCGQQAGEKMKAVHHKRGGFWYLLHKSNNYPFAFVPF